MLAFVGVVVVSYGSASFRLTPDSLSGEARIEAQTSFYLDIAPKSFRTTIHGRTVICIQAFPYTAFLQ